MKKYYFSLIFTVFFSFFLSNQLSAQSVNIDSLISATDKFNDSDTLKIFNYCDAAFKLGGQNEFDKALEVVSKAEAIIHNCKNEKIIALFNYVAGYINYSKLNYKESLSYLLKAVAGYEKLNNKSRVAACYTIIGFVYHDQTFFDKAEIYMLKSVAIREEMHDTMRMPGTYSNLGLNYYKRAQKNKKQDVFAGDMREASKYLNKSLEISRHLKLLGAEAGALGNLSNLMNDLKRYDEAEKFAKRSLEIYRSLGDTYEENVSLIDLGAIRLAQKKYSDAIKYFQTALEISTKNNYTDLIRFSYNNLWQAYEKTNDYKNMAFYLKLEKGIHDSVFNEENLRQINEMQIKYETEKKESENAFLLVKNELSDKAIKNQKMVILLVIIGLALALIFAFFIFRGLSKQKKANKIISQQKKEVEDKNHLINEQHELLEEKQKEILDSIKYAKRIQQAHLPTHKYVAKNLERLKK